MLPRIIGEHPLAKDADGKLKSRIATVFPYGNTIVTLPGIHATQRMAYVDLLARERSEQGLPPLSREEEDAEWQNSVDLIMEDDTILIRPDPDNMELRFRADELLQELVPKHRVQVPAGAEPAGSRRRSSSGASVGASARCPRRRTR